MSFSAALYRGLSRMTGGLFGWLDEDYQHDGDWMSAHKSLTYNPVWAAVNMIANAFAVMPLQTYRERGRSIEMQKTHSSYELLRWTPNPYQTPATFKRQVMCHALLWGNFRAYIVREGNRPVELIPMAPERCESGMLNGEKLHGYKVDEDDPRPFWEVYRDEPHKMVTISDRDVLHIHGLSFDGVKGLSVISLARQSFGLGLGAETFVSKQQKKGYNGGLMLEAPQGVFRKAEDAREFLDDFKTQHEGSDKAGTIGMLREGIKANMMAMSNTDAQFIEQRRFNVEDVERWFGMPGMLSNSRTSYASLEQTMLGFRASVLAPWATSIEEECDVKLLSQGERSTGYYHKFNDGALMRTEKSKTASFISQMVTSRVMNPNEGREMLDMNPYDGGDVYENPATTSGDQTTTDSGDDDENEREEDPLDNAATRARVKHLIGIEASRIVKAATKAAGGGMNYVQWVDDFYDQYWQPKLADWFTECGIDPVHAYTHCEKSKIRIMDELDKCTNETLVASMENLTKAWAMRADQIGDRTNVSI